MAGAFFVLISVMVMVKSCQVLWDEFSLGGYFCSVLSGMSTLIVLLVSSRSP